MSQLRIAPPSVPAGGPSTQRKIEKSGQAEDYRVLAECPSPGASVQTILVQFLGAYMHSLTNPNPIWSTAGSSSFEINKCTILAHMTSGRYRTKVVGTEQKPWQDSGLIRGKGSVSYQPVTWSSALHTWPIRIYIPQKLTTSYFFPCRITIFGVFFFKGLGIF